MAHRRPLEVHATIDQRDDAAATERFRDALRARIVTIELPTGDARSSLLQSMVTFAVDHDEHQLAELRARVDALAAEHGVRVLRVKVECPPRADSRALYRESHALLRGPRGWFDAPGDDVRAVVHRHGARLSRRVRREADGGAVERFFTRRDRGSFDETGARHRAWMDDLSRALAGHREVTVVKVHDEAVLWDDHEALDEGWR